MQWPREIRSRKSDRQNNGQDKSEAVNQTDNTMAKRKRTWTNNYTKHCTENQRWSNTKNRVLVRVVLLDL